LVYILPSGLFITDPGFHTIRIFDLKGKLLFNTIGKGAGYFPFSGFESRGMYILTIKTDKELITRRIVHPPEF
jgi:hypothetical protein